MKAEKAALRRKVKALYETLDDKYIASADSLIFKNLTALPEYQAAKVIYTYYSTGREVDTHQIIKAALKDGKTVLLPVITGRGTMQPRRLYSLEGLTCGEYNIPVPRGDESFYPLDSIDLVLVPGLAFDLGGFRLGKGGGYYDRLLSLCGGYAVGLSRDKTVFDQLPIQVHDMAVDCIVTEKSVARLR